MCINILIVDDHKLFRKGLRRILELEPDFRIVGEAGNSVEAMLALGEVSPDVILMDINMPGGNGIEATRRIKARYPEVNILVLTIHDDTEYLFEVVRAGAAGYLLKDVEPLRLCEAIRTVAVGGSVVNPGLGDKLMKEFARLSEEPAATSAPAVATQQLLSPRELEVLNLMAQGYSNLRIATELFISEKTVKNHVSSILRKLDVKDRTQAVVQGVKLKLVSIK